MEKTIRVYVDGVYDLFHRGHVESLEKAKHIRPDVYLIVGLISDSTATGYKREPIFTDDDRYKLLKACRYVDQIVYHPPLILTSEFLERYKIDLVVHGFSDLSDLKKQQPFFEQIKDKFELLPYFPYNSTSKYISKIGTYTQEPTKPTIKPKTKQITHFHGYSARSGPTEEDYGQYAASQEAHPPQRTPRRNQRQSNQPHPHFRQEGRERDRRRRQNGGPRRAERDAARTGARRCPRRAPQEHRVAQAVATQQASRLALIRFGAQSAP